MSAASAAESPAASLLHADSASPSRNLMIPGRARALVLRRKTPAIKAKSQPRREDATGARAHPPLPPAFGSADETDPPFGRRAQGPGTAWNACGTSDLNGASRVCVLRQ